MSHGSLDPTQMPEYLFISAMKELRSNRGWSQERLAREVRERTGYQLNPTAITKLEWRLEPERADQARSLRVNEAFAIAEAFETQLGPMIFDSERLERIDGTIERLLRKLVALSEEERQSQYQLEGARAERARILTQIESRNGGATDGVDQEEA